MSGARVDAKIVLLGKEYGGKTSLVERYLHNRFAGDLPYQNTIGAAYGAKRVEVYGRTVVLGIWDTAGSERYQAMSRIYYRGAWAAIVAFDLTDANSWDRAAFWAHELRLFDGQRRGMMQREICRQQEPTARLYFVGTKRDKLDDDPELRQVELRRVEKFASQLSETAAVLETSAKSGLGIAELFSQIAKDFVRAAANSAGDAADPSLDVYPEKDQTKPKCAC